MSSVREAELLEIIRLKDEENARLKVQIKLLEQKIDLLIRRIFGAKSAPRPLAWGRDSQPQAARRANPPWGGG